MCLFCTVVKERTAAWSASRSQCRMEGPGRVREPRANLILSCRRTSMWAPRGAFWFQIFIQASSPEIWSETISGGEKVLAGKWGGLFLGYLLGKNFRRRDRDHLIPPRRMDAAVCRAEVCYPFCRKHRKASGSETPRVHNVARWCGGRMAMLAIPTMPTWTPPKTPANDNLITLFVKDKG